MAEYVTEAAARAKRIIVLAGNASDEFAQRLRAEGERLGRGDLVGGPTSDLGAATREARAAAQPGDVVLLSPGFTSFGMFLNEFDRGEQFRTAVQALE
jgi:UDP-N-acetylmuramoylalanine--D-glutamate ligase